MGKRAQEVAHLSTLAANAVPLGYCCLGQGTGGTGNRRANVLKKPSLSKKVSADFGHDG